ncbi:hypothetical protein [Listeria seeligeri]|uniref:hypothetical protein n=1 Tax=Listeria seeligeri TaxID=1640 RepID=UPI0001C4EAE9|nr:hypothetical protein [Listeria seeligeri]CBH28198.1 hypothetical protein lse_2047 [Listeria seeligeri serovar 1/2b str. SLCC3954]
MADIREFLGPKVVGGVTRIGAWVYKKLLQKNIQHVIAYHLLKNVIKESIHLKL